MTTRHRGIPHYFTRSEGGFVASGLARSPWSRGTLAGGPVSSLLAAIADESGFDPRFNVARLTVEIFGTVPDEPLTPRVICLGEGRQMQLHRIELSTATRVAAQAHVLLVRDAETPAFAPPCDYPHPDALEDCGFMVGASMAGAIRSRGVVGGVRQPGRGIVWLACDGEIIAGSKPSPFVKAALFADFGNGVGSATTGDDWSFANLDITLQFLRMPIGEWLLIDAETHMAGNGHGTASNIFADVQGVYARGFQTVFVAPSTRTR